MGNDLTISTSLPPMQALRRMSLQEIIELAHESSAYSSVAKETMRWAKLEYLRRRLGQLCRAELDLGNLRRIKRT